MPPDNIIKIFTGPSGHRMAGIFADRVKDIPETIKGLGTEDGALDLLTNLSPHLRVANFGANLLTGTSLHEGFRKGVLTQPDGITLTKGTKYSPGVDMPPMWF